MAAVRSFEAKAVQSGRHSIVKDAQKYARELGLQLKLDFPDPVCYTADGHEVRGAKIKNCLTKAHQQELRDKVEGEKWQEKLTKSRWEDDSLKVEECFAWLHHWKTAPTYTIVGAHELYQQLLVPVTKDILQQENGNEHDWRRQVSTERQRTRERATHLGRLLCACAN